MSNDSKLPLVYSCSGASSAAQMPNHIAVKLDRLKVAEMSCIGGVGGDVKPLVKTADRHYDLSKMGVPKKKHEDFDPKQAAEILWRIVEESKIPVLHTSVAAELDTSPGTPEEELPEPSSPVCYAKEFKDW
jgi:uncharacterized metal-binding protein